MNKYLMVVAKWTSFHDNHIHDWFVEKFYLGWFDQNPADHQTLSKLDLVHFLNPYMSKSSFRGPSHAQNMYLNYT